MTKYHLSAIYAKFDVSQVVLIYNTCKRSTEIFIH